MYLVFFFIGKHEFICEKCGRKFQAKGNLKEHMASIHSTERPHKCSVCLKGYVWLYIKLEYFLEYQLIDFDF